MRYARHTKEPAEKQHKRVPLHHAGVKKNNAGFFCEHRGFAGPMCPSQNSLSAGSDFIPHKPEQDKVLVRNDLTQSCCSEDSLGRDSSIKSEKKKAFEN